MICRNCQQPIESCQCGYGSRFKEILDSPPVMREFIKRMEVSNKRIESTILDILFGLPLIESNDYSMRVN
jgi:hypothetical protein